MTPQELSSAVGLVGLLIGLCSGYALGRLHEHVRALEHMTRERQQQRGIGYALGRDHERRRRRA